MKIGILETGEISDDLVGKHGDYPSMYMSLLHAIDPSVDFFGVKVLEGKLPESPDEADGWIITGSKYGVYEDLPWIEPLKNFIRTSVKHKIPVAGICFGHQILAAALGGTVEKSHKGWGLGVHDYDIEARPSWMKGAGKRFSGHAVHQDQVIKLPESATVIATSEFCPFAALVYGDPENPDALSVQSHPEFSAGFLDDLIEIRVPEVFSEGDASNARATLGLPVDNNDWALWIHSFLELAARTQNNDP
ncbi:MAG: type 1 glutamine amidotransferase [Paracoccaceae bacterium]|jgi:GMP synthase-like glutamine amidotransferase